jgi:hypothetical protein
MSRPLLRAADETYLRPLFDERAKKSGVIGGTAL